MSARWRTRARELWGSHAVRIATGSSSALVLLAIARLAEALLLCLATALLVIGLAHGARTIVHLRDPDHAEDAELLRLACVDLRFSSCWVGASLVLAGCVLVGVSTLAVALGGAVTACAVYAYAILNAGDTVEREIALDIPHASATVKSSARVQRWINRAQRAPMLPLTKRFGELWGDKTPAGQISAYLASLLLAVFVIGLGYAIVAAAEIASEVRGALAQPDDKGGAATPPDMPTTNPPAATPRSTPSRIVAPAPSYAQLCPVLPDPRTISHGLGALFERDGAIQAGCGEQPERSPGTPPVWFARGMCTGEMRSLAIAAAGRAPVLLYGEPARFAQAAATAGTLRYVQRSRPAGGDLYIVTTSAGSTVFARPISSTTTDVDEARRCGEVAAVARVFARLPPALSELWVRHVHRDGWSWPIVSAGTPARVSFVEPVNGDVTAVGTCDSDGFCSLDGDGEHRTSGRGVDLSLADLEPHLPPERPAWAP